jgi:hypothetical protein
LLSFNLGSSLPPGFRLLLLLLLLSMVCAPLLLLLLPFAATELSVAVPSFALAPTPPLRRASVGDATPSPTTPLLLLLFVSGSFVTTIAGTTAAAAGRIRVTSCAAANCSTAATNSKLDADTARLLTSCCLELLLLLL